MSVQRKLSKIYTPEGQPGFLGEGHIARPLIKVDFAESDPFIMLMDDMLDKKDDQAVGGPHPHAGFETVSLLLEGSIGDEAHMMKAGDFQKMTAGSGIIHTETIHGKTKMRLLQLWLNLPKKDRWTLPKVQDLPVEHVPVITGDGINIKVYSGSLNGVTSPVEMHTPVIVADIELGSLASSTLNIPAIYNGFLYVLEGGLMIGNDNAYLNKDQVGWLDGPTKGGNSELTLTAGNSGTRVILYAGEPQGDPIVSYGPFIADTQADIKRLYHEFQIGKMKHISTVPTKQRIMW
jgi:hypothetical protein